MTDIRGAARAVRRHLVIGGSAVLILSASYRRCLRLPRPGEKPMNVLLRNPGSFRNRSECDRFIEPVARRARIVRQESRGDGRLWFHRT
jgi:hypothetical protein